MLITRSAGVWCLLCLAALSVVACSGGGGDDDTPVAPWSRLRAGANNAALATGSLDENLGQRRTVLALGPNVQHFGIDGLPVTVGGITGSTPIIGINELIYLGTTAGLLVTNKDATRVRVFDDCNGVPVGPVSGTAAINLNNDVAFGDDNGRVFAFNDDETTFECLFVFPAPPATPIPNGIVSSPLIISDVVDRTLVSVYLGTGSGHLQALNTFGLPQWRFPTGSEAFPGPLTSSIATDGVSFHVTAPDGVLYSLDRAGRLQHQARISLAGDSTPLLASPIAGTSIYAIGVGGRCGDSITECLDDVSKCTQGCLDDSECSGTECGASGERGVLTALTPVDEIRWRFGTDARIAGSATFVIQGLDEAAPPLATPTVSTPPPTPNPSVPSPSPTPTPTRLTSILQGVIYLVDTTGTVYGVKDVSGELFVVRPQPPTNTPVTPGAATPTPGPTNSPTEVPTKAAKADIVDDVNVTSSPALSNDLFVVFGTEQGGLYAIQLDFARPMPCAECPTPGPRWTPVPLVNDAPGGGKVDLGEPVVSSPIIDRDGTIYVTTGHVSTGEGTLYAVGSP